MPMMSDLEMLYQRSGEGYLNSYKNNFFGIAGLHRLNVPHIENARGLSTFASFIRCGRDQFYEISTKPDYLFPHCPDYQRTS